MFNEIDKHIQQQNSSFTMKEQTKIVKSAIHGSLAYIPYLVTNLHSKYVKLFYEQIGRLIMTLRPK